MKHNDYFIVIPIETIFDTNGTRLLPRELMTLTRIVNAHRIAMGNMSIADPVVQANAILLRALSGSKLHPRTTTLKAAKAWCAERMESGTRDFFQWDQGRTLTTTREHIWAQVDSKGLNNVADFISTPAWWTAPRVKKVMIRAANPEMAQDPARFFGVDDYVPPFDPFFYTGPEHNADLVDPEAI